MKEPKNQPGRHSKLIQFRKPSDHPSVKKKRKKEKKRKEEKKKKRKKKEREKKIEEKKENKMRRPA